MCTLFTLICVKSAAHMPHMRWKNPKSFERSGFFR